MITVFFFFSTKKIFLHLARFEPKRKVVNVFHHDNASAYSSLVISSYKFLVIYEIAAISQKEEMAYKMLV